MPTLRSSRFTGWIATILALATFGLHLNATAYVDAADLRDHMSVLANDARSLSNGCRFAEIAVDAVASPEYVLFGDTVGRGTVYMRATTFEERTTYWAIDYHFVRQDGVWRLQDSSLEIHGSDLRTKTDAAIRKGRFALVKH